MAFKIGNTEVLSVDQDGETILRSATGDDIVFYPGQNIWIKQGTKLIFEGTLPDEFEAKLQATDLTADRNIILPDADGILLTEADLVASNQLLQDYVDAQVAGVNGGTLIAGVSTDDLVEGSTNLYYTDARAIAAIQPLINSAETSANNYTDTSSTATLSTAQSYTDAQLLSSTSNITQAYQSYASNGDTTTLSNANSYTDSKVAAISLGTLNGTTDNINEGSTNLYYNDARVRVVLSADNIANRTYVDTAEINAVTSANAYTQATVANLTTNDIPEGINLYYTDTRVSSFLTSQGYVTQADITGIIDGAPAALDTLNELAAALNDDPNFATTITNNIATKVSKSGDTMTGTLVLSGAPVNANDAVTKSYVDSAVSSVSSTVGNLTTNDVVEGTNLYYTDARVDARIPTNISAFANDSGYLTQHQDLSSYALQTQLFSGDYSDLTNKPTIPVVPTNVSAFVNDAGYITSFTDTTYTAGTGLDLTGTVFSVDNTIALKSELFSGSYNDLTDTPTIPTNVSDFTNDAGYLTSYTETDPIFSASEASNITSTDTTNWDTAFGWGDHSTAGYLTTHQDLSSYATQAYVNTAVSNLVDSAPGTLDTLNELAAALNDDANFAVTVAGDIATKVSKAGDFMSGPLSLSGAPTANLHAATKAYVDSAVSSVSGTVSSLSSDDVVEGSTNLYYTDARSLAALSGADTDDIAEGTNNLYYTNARVDTRIGYQTGVNLDLSQKNTDHLVEGSNLYYTTARQNADFDTRIAFYTGGFLDLSQKTTNDLPEGNVNLFFTNARADARADARIAAATTDDISEGSTNLYFTNARADARVDLQTGANLDLSSKTTTDLSEGTNLYYTNARVDTRIGYQTGANLDLSQKTTDNLSEGANNLYFTTTRANAAFNAQIPFFTGANLDLSQVTSDVLPEGNANLFYTNSRVRNVLTNDGYATQVYVNDAINNLIDGAPAAYNTLKEISDAMATDAELTAAINNLSIPTAVSELTNDAGYITSYVNTTYTAGNGLTLTGTQFKMSGSYTGDFTASGDVTAYSDRRFKHNIETIDNALDKVTKMRGVSYEKDNRNSIGVIAQEVEEVIPEVVHTDSDGLKSVAYGNIVGVLIEAIKEQQELIERLQEEVSNLKK